jgi:Leucine-rich repeat (LRR) protein
MIDVGPIAHLTGLERLVLSGWDNVRVLPSLKSLEHLQHLNISLWGKLLDLTPLKALTNLRTLNLTPCGGITDLGPFTGLTNLRALSLVGVHKIVDFTPLMGLGLTTIYVDQILLRSLPPRLKYNAQVLELSDFGKHVKSIPEDQRMILTASDLFNFYDSAT